jgi:hypothetical protein
MPEARMFQELPQRVLESPVLRPPILHIEAELDCTCDWHTMQTAHEIAHVITQMAAHHLFQCISPLSVRPTGKNTIHGTVLVASLN